MKTIRDALAAMLAAVAVVGVSGCATMDGAACRYEKTQALMAADAAERAVPVLAQWALTGSEEARLAAYRDNLLFAGRMFEAVSAAFNVSIAAAFQAEMQRFRYALERGDLEAIETIDYLAWGKRLGATHGDGIKFSRSKWREYTRMFQVILESQASGMAAAARHETNPKDRTALQDTARLAGWLSSLLTCYLATGNERQALKFLREMAQEL